MAFASSGITTLHPWILRMSEIKPFSPGSTVVIDQGSQRCSRARRYGLLVLCCLGIFPMSFNDGAIFPAIPFLAIDLHASESDLTWIISASKITSSSLLLIVGPSHTIFRLSANSHTISRVVESVTFMTQVPLITHPFYPLLISAWVTEYIFVCGVAVEGVLSICLGFSTTNVSFIVIRALSGIGMFMLYSFTRCCSLVNITSQRPL